FSRDWSSDVCSSDLDRHIGWDIGIAGVARQLASLLDAWTVLQPYSRLVIDCNRPPDSPTSIVATSDGTDVPANAALSPAQRQARLQSIFMPYHACISQQLDTRAASSRPT